MKFADLSFGKKTILELRYADNSVPIPRSGDPVDIRQGDSNKDVIIKTSHGELRANPADEKNSTLLDKVFGSACYRLWRIVATPKSRLILAVHEFPGELFLGEMVSIGVDEKVIDLARQKKQSYSTVEEVVKWLNDELILTREESSDRYVFLTGTPGNQNRLAGAFRLLGRSVSVDVKTDKTGRLQVERVVYAQKNVSASNAQSVHLVRGSIEFVDGTSAQEFRGLAKDLIEQVIEGGESYLALWNRYNEIERKIRIAEARDFGVFPFESFNVLNDGNYEFTLCDSFDGDTTPTIGDTGEAYLEAASQPPAEFSLQPEETPSTQQRIQRTFLGTLESIRGNRVTLKPSDEDTVEPPSQGYLFQSIRGDSTRLRRREEAQKRIITGVCPMPQLGLILEGRHTPEQRIKPEKPLSPAAKKAFRGDPTDRQVEALDVALNTPDIVLIQGPPGTGKTRVIAALQSRLAEIHGDHSLVSGRILLTSYQHDAVENAAEATEIFGLPAIKIGNKYLRSAGTDGFQRWLEDRKEAVDGQLFVVTKKSISPIIDKINRLESSYRKSSSAYVNLVNLLKELECLAAPYLGEPSRDLLIKLKSLTKGHGRGQEVLPENVSLALKAIRGLRTKVESFTDDGPDQAYKARKRLQGFCELDGNELKLLDKLANLEPDEIPESEDLEQLKLLQELWIDRLSVNNGGEQTKHGSNPEVISLFQSIKADLRKRLAQDPTEGVDAALHEYRIDLNDEATMRRTIEHYSTSLAATCQQAVGSGMIDLKGDTHSCPSFEYVIVDEAARANPLDLLIPMSLAERKIILVGDHRQLPHILETEIENEMETAMQGSSMRDKVNGILRESLFERLFKLMKERENKDGTPRTVTLDQQFRMHPMLGQFVSDTFYKPYGEGFESGRSAEEMGHRIKPYFGSPAAWVSLPKNKGSELKGISKARPVEAKWVANEAIRIMEAHPELSVGIITFYRKQVDLINEELEKHGAVERDDNGQISISQRYRQTRDVDSGKLKERLRVGTVDAFQGKEFDVVLLSIVRSNDILVTEDTKSLRRKFGHLILENRLCVGMSRQQRLLIVCGDSGMLNDTNAQEAVSGLVAFHKLCKDQGKVINV